MLIACSSHQSRLISSQWKYLLVGGHLFGGVFFSLSYLYPPWTFMQTFHKMHLICYCGSITSRLIVSPAWIMDGANAEVQASFLVIAEVKVLQTWYQRGIIV